MDRASAATGDHLPDVPVFPGLNGEISVNLPRKLMVYGDDSP
jgi:hypothetical protein